MGKCRCRGLQSHLCLSNLLGCSNSCDKNRAETCGMSEIVLARVLACLSVEMNAMP